MEDLSKQNKEFEQIFNLASKVFQDKNVFYIYPLFIDIYGKGSSLDGSYAVFRFNNTNNVSITKFEEYLSSAERELIVSKKDSKIEAFSKEYKKLFKEDLKIKFE